MLICIYLYVFPFIQKILVLEGAGWQRLDDTDRKTDRHTDRHCNLKIKPAKMPTG